MSAMLSGWLKTDSASRLGLATIIFFISYAVVVSIQYYRATATTLPMPKLRRVAGLDAIDEAIGRATEMGRPVTFNTGASAISAATLAAIAVMGYVAHQTAKFDTRLIVPMRFHEVVPIALSTIQMAHIEVGKPETFRPDDVRYLSSDQFGFTSGCIGIIQRERVAAQMLFGNFVSEALILAEEGSIAGAMQIAGQVNVAQTPFLIAACDYTLLQEELYVASAYLSKNRIRIGMIAAQDAFKLILVGIIMVGIIASAFGSSIVSDLLTLY